MSVLEVRNLKKSFGKDTVVLKGVDFSLEKGETVAIIGSSGSGKTTLLRCLNFLTVPDEGQIVVNDETLFDDADPNTQKEREIRRKRLHFGLVFQNFNLFPQYTARQNVMLASELLAKEQPDYKAQKKLLHAQIAARAEELLTQVGLKEKMDLYPHQLSGGMRQRVMIAMALACRPKLLIADEPTTALDVTIQAQILKLMNELREKNGTAVLFITHDLGVINQMADNVAVMYCGQVVEYAPAGTIFHKNEYSHPYTEGLMLSIPRLDTPSDERLEAIPGAVPHPLDLPKGCKFAPRCKYATERCLEEEPELIHVSDTQQVRCFYAKKEDRHAK